MGTTFFRGLFFIRINPIASDLYNPIASVSVNMPRVLDRASQPPGINPLQQSGHYNPSKRY